MMEKKIYCNICERSATDNTTNSGEIEKTVALMVSQLKDKKPANTDYSNHTHNKINEVENLNDFDICKNCEDNIKKAVAKTIAKQRTKNKLEWIQTARC